MSNWREMLKEAKELFDDGFIDEAEYKQLKAEALAVRAEEKGAAKTPNSGAKASDTFAGKTSFSRDAKGGNASDTFSGGTQFYQNTAFNNQPSTEYLGEIGQYFLVEEIGVGGMGNVYRAKHKIEAFAQQTSEIAIKLMKPELATDEEFRNRFIREASTGRNLNHNNIAQIYDVIPESDGRLGLVMELVDGKELEELIPSDGMDMREALPIIKQIVAGVEYLHSKGVIHRDLKPENIMVSSKGIVKILDMGIAKNTMQENTNQTQTGTALGTPLYMAPEQLNAKDVEPSADNYAVGLIVYKMLSGRLPWKKGAGAGDILAAKFGGQLEPFKGKNAFVASIVMEMLTVMVDSRPSLSKFLRHLSVSPQKQQEILKKEAIKALQIWADRLERQIKELSKQYSKDKQTLLALSNLSYRKQWMEKSKDWKIRLQKTEQDIPKILQQAETRGNEQKALEKSLKEQAGILEKKLQKAEQELKDVPEFQKFVSKISFQKKSHESLEKWQKRLNELNNSLSKTIEQGHQRLKEIEQEKIRLEQAKIKREEARKEEEKNKKRVAELEGQLIIVRAKYIPIIEKEEQRAKQLQKRVTEVKKEHQEAIKQREVIDLELKNFMKKRAQIAPAKNFIQQEMQKKEVERHALENSMLAFGKANRINTLNAEIYQLEEKLKKVIVFAESVPQQKQDILKKKETAQKTIKAKKIYCDGLVHSHQELRSRISRHKEEQNQEEEAILWELRELAKKGNKFRSHYLNAGSKSSAQKTKPKKKQKKSKQPKGSLKEMILIPKGDFLMGALPNDSNAGKAEYPRHQVQISKSFWMGKYPVTQGFWEEVMGYNNSKFQGDDHPVEKVSWFDCIQFCNQLSEKEGLQPVYHVSGAEVSCNWDASGYRLPTEVEWEYAARSSGNIPTAKARPEGGTVGWDAARGEQKSTLYAGSNTSDSVAWYSTNSEKSTQPVGEKEPNAFGLHDMAGNVWEWVWDIFDKNAYKKRRNGITDPTGPASGKERINRGGCWYSAESATRLSFRCGDQPYVANSFLGFRIVRLEE